MPTFPAHESYKDSEVEWLGEIPRHWNVEKAKYIWKEIEDRSIDGDEKLLSVSQHFGVVPRDGDSRSESLIDYKKCESDDLVINIMLAWMGGLGVSEHEGIVSPAYCVYRLQKKANSRYLGYLYRTPIYLAEFARCSTGVVPSRWRMYTEDFGQVPTLIPTIPEQDRIVEFLDRTTTEIDRAISQKQRLIELLQEQKAILINQAVTKGLNPNVPMLDSGIERIGKIPEHWDIAKLKFISTNIGDGIHATPEYIDDSNYYFVNGNNLILGKVCFTDATRCVSENEFKKHKIELDEDTILISINGTIGNIAFYQGELIILGKSAAYIKGIKVEKIHKYFLGHFLISSSARQYFFDEVTGSTIYNLSLRSLRNTAIPVPPLEEQFEIISFLDDALNRLAEMEKNIQLSIRTIQEWRNVLIANAVTGKIKV